MHSVEAISDGQIELSKEAMIKHQKHLGVIKDGGIVEFVLNLQILNYG